MKTAFPSWSLGTRGKLRSRGEKLTQNGMIIFWKIETDEA